MFWLESEGKRPLGRPEHKWNDIRMDLRKVACKDVDWINLSQDRDHLPGLLNTIMKLRVP